MADTQKATEQYDAAQTVGCNALRLRLQSIASLAVESQDLDPSGDPLADQLRDIADDLNVAQALNAALSADKVYDAARIARTGRIV